MSIKTKQVAGVTTLVVAIVAILSGYHLSTLSRFLLQESAARADLLWRALSQRARIVVAGAAGDPYQALREDGGIRSILESSAYSPHVTYVTIVDPAGIPIASFPTPDAPLPPQDPFEPIKDLPAWDRLGAIYSDRTFDVSRPLLSDAEEFATIRIGVQTLLVQQELRGQIRDAATIVIAALVLSSLVALLLSHWMLRPIHIIQSGLHRLGRGELDVQLDLPEQEFKDLGSSFQAVSAQLAAGRGAAPAEGSVATVRSEGADFASVMENLEDGVALFSPRGELIFSNSAMRAFGIDKLPDAHPMRQLVDRTLATRKSSGPVSISLPRVGAADSFAGAQMGNGPGPQGEELAAPDPNAERLLVCHAIEDTAHRFVGAMLVVRNVGYLTRVHSTLNYSRKAAALGRLLAGVAHEVKNPLNAMTIHLELLKQKLGSLREPIVVPAADGKPGKTVDLLKHVQVISSEIKRLDEVVAGFLKFARPEELKLQPTRLHTVIHDVVTTIGPEAHRQRITVREECAPTTAEINADQGMLTQAVLNLAINAVQAMPDGGTLRIGCRDVPRGRVELYVEDTGEGIPPENLPRIFDLYFTTKEKGSGIGLSMVFRIVQLHDGEVEVQSTPGRGTRFTLTFPRAASFPVA